MCGFCEKKIVLATFLYLLLKFLHANLLASAF